MSRFWTSFATAINLRALVPVLAAILALTGWHPLRPWLETRLFEAGTALMEPKRSPLSISIVELNSEELRQLTGGNFNPGIADPADGQQPPLPQAQILPRLNRLLTTSATAGVLLPSALNWSDNDTQTLLRKLLPMFPSAMLPERQHNRLRFFLQQREVLYDRLNGDQVTLGMVVSNCRGDTPAPSEQPLSPSHRINRLSGNGDTYFAILPLWLQPLPPLLGTPPNARSSLALAPFTNCPRLARPLVWQLSPRHEQQFTADFTLALYQRFSHAAQVHWDRSGRMSVGDIHLPLSADAGFIPLVNTADTSLSIHRYPLDQYQQARKAKILLIGASGDPALETAAAALLALEHRSYLYTPAPAYWLQKLLYILLACYLFFALPRVGVAVGTLLSCLLATVLLFAQLGWQITQWIWLPLYEPLGFLIAGHLLILLWLFQRRQHQRLVEATDTAHYQLGLQLYRDGRSEEALKTLANVATSPPLLELMYDIGAQQERNRFYAEALQTYRIIEGRARGYRDVAEKVSRMKLVQLSDSAALGNSLLNNSLLRNNVALAKTLVLTDEKVNKPVLGRYEIDQEIGRGAMGVVYLGRDPKIARRVAIKTLNYAQFDPSQLPEVKERFFREAEAAGRLNHPSIVTVYDVGEERDMAFIAMDYLEGRPLSEFVQESTLLPVPEVYKIMAQVAEALHFAHGKHIVHRDIKPANIIYNQTSGQVTVTDFGIARITDDSRTRTGDIMGSPLYMSPEQLRGDRVGQAADIFSLGVTLYQLLTGRLPFQGDNLANLTYQIIHSNHKSVREWRSNLPYSAPRIINKALQKSPDKRFTTAKDMCEAMRKSLRKDFESVPGD